MNSGESNGQFLITEPGHRCGLVGQAGVDQIRIVCAFVERHHDRVGRDLHFA